jgi:hypothetical protein
MGRFLSLVKIQIPTTEARKVLMTNKPSQALLALLVIVLAPTVVRNSHNPYLAHPRGPLQVDPDRQPMPSKSSTYVSPIAQNFVCSPAPCVLPNVDLAAGARTNETPVVVNPSNPNQLLAGANDNSCPNGIGMFTSNDGGSTWTGNCMSAVTGDTGQADPGVAYDLQGTAYITAVDLGATGVVAISKSTDNGNTWSAAQPAVPNLTGFGYPDKPWLQIDTNPSSPYANALYISATQFASDLNTEISVSHSSDGGSTWQTVAVDTEQIWPAIDQFSDLAIGKDGTVYLTWMRCTNNGPRDTCADTTATFELSQSSDGGNTWTAPQAIFTTNLSLPATAAYYGGLPNGITTPISNIPVIAIDNSSGPHAGNLYIAYYNWTGYRQQKTGYLQLLLATSGDRGATWSTKAVTPASDRHDQFFPWVSVSSTGMVGVSWMDRRNDPLNVKYQAFAAFSSNGGASFGKNVNLSAAASNPGQYGFIGDYSGNAWSQDGSIFYVTYTDTTTGVDQDFLAGVRLR